VYCTYRPHFLGAKTIIFRLNCQWIFNHVSILQCTYVSSSSSMLNSVKKWMTIQQEGYVLANLNIYELIDLEIEDLLVHRRTSSELK
jgi:hypothetical protein